MKVVSATLEKRVNHRHPKRSGHMIKVVFADDVADRGFDIGRADPLTSWIDIQEHLANEGHDASDVDLIT